MVNIDGHNLTIELFKRIVIGGERVIISKSALQAVEKSHNVIRGIVKGKIRVYGVTTGFGKLVEIPVPMEHINQLQKNILRSHAVGVGDALDYYAVRGSILLRVNTIIRGHSGVSPSTLKVYTDMLNKGLYPYVPSKGSVGASGDLAPLSHIALAAMGEGEFIQNGKRVSARTVLRKNNIKPIDPRPKEGLALINGTQVMTSIAGIALIRTLQLIKTADIAAAASSDALRATDTAFRKDIQDIRNQKGQKESAYNLRNLMKNSGLRKAHLKCGRIQDAYSVRCTPQVHGAVRDAYNYARDIVEREMNSSTDNPLVITDKHEVVSGGNFHGETIAIPVDALKIAVSELASISERRLYRLMDENETGLKPFITNDPGLNSGFMMLHVTAASLVSENKILSHPASVDSIPTSLGQEDHVSMGTIGARKLAEVVDNTADVLSIELFAALSALRMHSGKTSPVLEAMKRSFFRKIRPADKDRPFYRDIEKIRPMLLDGLFCKVANKYFKLK